MIETESELREVIGSPTRLVTGKVADRLNDIFREYIVRSPFLCIATCSPDGALDVSPRGDPAGFVRVLDDRHVLLPDRIGKETFWILRTTDFDAMVKRLKGNGVTFRSQTYEMGGGGKEIVFEDLYGNLWVLQQEGTEKPAPAPK